jgi:ATP-dependent protease Clp ATPase subunit
MRLPTKGCPRAILAKFLLEVPFQMSQAETVMIEGGYVGHGVDKTVLTVRYKSRSDVGVVVIRIEGRQWNIGRDVKGGERLR